jgi:hypothetical protein
MEMILNVSSGSRFRLILFSFGGLLGFLSEHSRSFGFDGLHCSMMSRTRTALASGTMGLP